MSNRAAESVRWLSKATGCAFDVLMAIADFADADGWAYPGTETLARVSHWHERTVKRGLAELRARHADELEQPGQGNGCHHRNSYRVKLIDRYPEALAEKQRWKDRQRGLDNGDTVTPLDDPKGEGPSPLDDKKGDSVTPFAAQRVTDRHPFGHPNGDSLSQKGDGGSPILI